MKKQSFLILISIFIFSGLEAQNFKVYTNISIGNSSEFNTYPNYLKSDIKELNRFQRDSYKFLVALERGQERRALKLKFELEEQMRREIAQTKIRLNGFKSNSYNDEGLRSKRQSSAKYSKRGSDRKISYNREFIELENRLRNQIRIQKRVLNMPLYSDYRGNTNFLIYENLLFDFQEIMIQDLESRRYLNY